jgi:hypothetical protein
MPILKFVPIAMLLFSGPMREVQQAPAAPAETRRLEDVYAIYSRMISAGDEIYLIEATTLTQKGGFGSLFRPSSGAQPYPPCVQAPPADAEGLAEILADYEARKDISVALQREFALDKPYRLLNGDEVRTFLEDALKGTPQVLPRGGIPPFESKSALSQSETCFPFRRRLFQQEPNAGVDLRIHSDDDDGRRRWMEAF